MYSSVGTRPSASPRNGIPHLAPKPELERPMDNRFRAGLDPHLIKPGVARLGQGLDEVERAAVFLFPIVKRQISDLDGRDALV